jgi:ferredoxin
MAWHLEVDGQTCISSGMCAALAPHLFELREDHSYPVSDTVEPDDLALDAADTCPAGAITVTEDGKLIGPRD